MQSTALPPAVISSLPKVDLALSLSPSALTLWGNRHTRKDANVSSELNCLGSV